MINLDPRLLDLAWLVSPATMAAYLTRDSVPELRWRPAPHLIMLSDWLVEAALGQRSRLIACMPPQNGKPVYNGCMILMSDGSRKRLDEIVVGDYVIGHSRKPCKVTDVHDQGLLPAMCIKTELGREVIAALDHPFLTPEGWKEVRHLRAGDTLAVLDAPATIPSSDATMDEFILAGYFLGDGCTGVPASGMSSAANITNADPGIVEDFTAAGQRLGFRVNKVPRANYRYDFSAMPGAGRDTGPRPWLRKRGLNGSSWTKRVPAWVFTGSNSQISAFLGAYFGCDGHVNTRGKDRHGGQRKDPCCEFYSVNRGLLRDTQHLLLRLGVRSRLTAKNGLDQLKRPHKSWRLTIASVDDVANFRDQVRIVGDKLRRLREWPLQRKRFTASYLPDAITEITDVGLQPCRCLTVETDHTFTVEDLVVHNSSLVAHWFPAWLLALWPHKRIMYITYASTQAEVWGRRVRNTLVQHKSMVAARVSDDSAAVALWTTTAGGQMASIGIDGPVAGKPADVLIIDDPYSGPADAQSPAYRERVWRFYQENAYPRLAPGGIVVLLHTRWHEDDLIGRVMAAERAA